MNKVMECIMTRRSVRQFKETTVPLSEIQQIVEAARYAPTGMGTQDRHFTVISNQDKLKLLNHVIQQALVSSKNDFLRQNANNEHFSLFYHAPVLIIISAGKDNLTPIADCAVALENMFLAAHEIGISSCWINSLNELQRDKLVKSAFTELGIPENYTVYCAGAFGYNAGKDPVASPRREGTVTILQ